MKQATLSLFNEQQGEQLRDEAITAVDKNADEDWKTRALEAIRQTAIDKRFFQGDEIWKLIEKPREPRALGAVMKRAQSKKWIQPTADWKPSRIATQHRQPIRVWESLIFVK